MKLRTILLSLLLACAAQGQTLKSLMYNTTNGQVAYSGTNNLNFVANLNDTPASFSSSSSTMSIVVSDEGLSAGYDAPSGSIGSGGNIFQIKHGPNNYEWASPLLIDNQPGVYFGGTWLTNTNVTNFRTAIGLGATSDVTFDVVRSTFGFRVESGTNQQVYIGDDVVEMLVPLNIYAADGISFDGSNAALAAAATRANLGFSTNLNTLWTSTNASNARMAIGLGASNVVSFGPMFLQDQGTYTLALGDTNTGFRLIAGDSSRYGFHKQGVLIWDIAATNDTFNVAVPMTFGQPATTRTNLGLPLAALTNTSNVTMMRSLSGSTNTNEPYSGSISVVGTNNTNTLVFSNGILQSVQ